jgi:predicted CopG family antitoxin
MALMAKTSPKTKPKPEPVYGPASHEEMQTTAIHITKHDWVLLRQVSFKRAQDSGGRASVSEVIRALIEANRNELEREVKQ